ncbi:FAD-dependent oxidoreductase, partial [Paraburkholderia sp. BR14319]|uniref:FAD-dependent oxidoreductase n=1 Tax=Paraburkholderia sp. BR14319 TaxID=3237005 RepID=UPI0034D3249E
EKKGLENMRIAIIGAGIVGSSLAYHLATRGANVYIFDTRRAGSASIELRGVEHSYTNGKKILHGMDLSLDGKGLISLIGPS